MVCNITKLPESGDLCGNISEFEVAKDYLAHRSKVIQHHPKQSDIAT